MTNDTLQCLDDYSATTAQMQTATDPYAAKTESLATSGAGELERLRFVIERTFGWSTWYRHSDNIDFNHRASAVDGSGLGRHVTAVGYHSWSGSNRWPAITSVATHTTGFLWGAPGALTVGGAANHHLTVMIDATNDSGRFGVGQTNARTWFSFHAAALTLHHTAALRFAHSESQMHAGQRGHVTALRIDPGTDQVIVGHRGSALRFEGAGYTEGANRVLMLSESGQGLQARQMAVSGGSLGLTHSATGLTLSDLGLGTANQLLAMNTAGTAQAYKTLVGSGAISITHAATSLTISTDILSTNNTWSGINSFTKAYSASYAAGTGSLLWTPDANNGNVQRRIVNASGTLSVPTNPVAGMTIILIIVQDGTGSRVVTWGSGWHFPGGTEGVLSTAANAIDVLSGVYDGTNWLVSLSKDHKA